MALSSGDPASICRALVAIALGDADWKWAQDKCLEFLADGNPDISGVAATCLGHIARVHRKIDKPRVIEMLHRYRANSAISGRINDALDDIARFT